MAIIPSTPPVASRAALTRWFAAREFGASAASDAGRVSALGELLPHRAFVMTAEDAAAGRAPGEAARYWGWRYVLGSHNGINVAVVADEQVENRHVLSEINHGPFAVATPDAFNAMADVGAGQTDDFELAFLGLPGLHLEAFWLKSRSGASDLLLPFGTTPPGVSRTIYTLTEWIPVVQEVARRAIEIGG